MDVWQPQIVEPLPAKNHIAQQKEGGAKNKGPEVRSQLVRVDMDGTAEVLAGSSDEAIFDMALDDKGRPLFAYGRTIHEHCPRRAHFDAGRFARQYGDIAQTRRHRRGGRLPRSQGGLHPW